MRPFILKNGQLFLFLVLTNSLFAQSALPQIKVPANWEQQGITIRLKDDLNHPQFSWPLTRVAYQLDFGAANPVKNEFNLIDQASGKSIPFQLIDSEFRNGHIQKATLTFCTDLVAGSDKTFRLVPGNFVLPNVAGKVTTEKEGNKIILSNGLVRVEISGGDDPEHITPPIQRFGNMLVWLGHGEMTFTSPFKSMRVNQVHSGPVLSEYEVRYEFGNNKSYTVNLKLGAGMEFLEMEEEMSGFLEEDHLSWRMIWDGVQPETRYFATRNENVKDPKRKDYANINWEPMEGIEGSPAAEKHPYLDYDQQNSEDGKLPFRIATYDNWMSWWRLPTAAFWSEKQNITIGLFVKDTEKWNDGHYPVWGSKENLSIYFHWKNKVLDYTFPLVPGTRSTALATYAHDKDISLINKTGIPLAYIDFLRRWYGWIPLNKVQGWVLNYDAQNNTYPKYFKQENVPASMTLENLEIHLFNSLRSIAQGSERTRGPNPVGTRVFYDNIAPAFDLNASKMNPGQFKRLRAWFLFMNYVFMDEALMPIRTLLSGHPNFLADIKGVSGLTAFLFQDHPKAKEIADHFEKSVRLNFNYHTRPDVKAWEAKGGRWTENLATYTWAALKPTVRTSYLLHNYFDGRNRILQPGISRYADWLLNAISSPVQHADNRRLFPPQGAHAHAYGGGPPNVFRLLAQELVYYDPLLAEKLLYVTTAEDSPFESNKEKDKAWGELLKGEWENNKGTNPHLRSAKYTGYGFVLRSHFGTSEEMYVNLQQIDEGPNYRWGRAAAGGNGVIYYYAQGKRYSHNGSEDVGDGPFGDVERCTNFGVKKAPGYRGIGPYRSVGRNNLTEPLYDFGFAQIATVKANAMAAPEYRSRSVMQCGADYIIVFDDVADENIEGRFSWFVGVEDDFPAIYQISPGVKYISADIKPSQSNYHKDPEVLPTKGRYYDGKGDFLTMVTHKPDIKVNKTYYGCEVLKPGGFTDKVFRSDIPLEYNQDGFRFKGTAGLLWQLNGKNKFAAALFTGTEIAVPGLGISLRDNSGSAISVQSVAGGFKGEIHNRQSEKVTFNLTGKARKNFLFYLDGQLIESDAGNRVQWNITFPSGKHTWQLTSTGIIPEATKILSTFCQSESAKIMWQPMDGASAYRVQLSKDNGITWVSVADDVREPAIMLSELTNDSKIHVRVISKSAYGESVPSDEYPVYVTGKAPHSPEGLLANTHQAEIKITWGEVLGTGQYHLYRRMKNLSDTTFTESYKRIYNGPTRQFKDHKPDQSIVYEYVVTAENGNGESLKSASCDTDPASFLNWEPIPGEGFRRDTEDHENGFREFNPFIEDTMPVLSYPR